MKSRFEIFIDTDIITEHLSKGIPNEDSGLLKCNRIFDNIYTSVINASEIFSQCVNDKMIKQAKELFEEVSILGIPFRYSLKTGEILKAINRKKTGNTLRDALVVAMCAETKLPLYTSNESKYKDIAKLFKVKLINKDIILKYNSPELIFKKVKIL